MDRRNLLLTYPNAYQAIFESARGHVAPPAHPASITTLAHHSECPIGVTEFDASFRQIQENSFNLLKQRMTQLKRKAAGFSN